MEREEQIRLARQLLESCVLSEESANAIKADFPELAESEDEMIRKNLHNFFLNAKLRKQNLGVGVSNEKILTYLEKQKELERIVPERDATDFEIEVHEIIAQARSDKRLADKDVLEQFEQEAACALMWKVEKQKEQVPAQTETEKRYVRTLKTLVSDFIRDRNPEDVPYYQGIFDWLEGRHIEQKPAEWSEEDEKTRKEIINFLSRTVEKGFMKIDDRIKSHFWFKFLDNIRPQPKMEWSEEDEKRLNHCISLIEVKEEAEERFLLCCGLDNLNSRELDVEWLKSIRPHTYWKPSEEQMEQLRSAAALPEFGPMVTTRKQFPDLELLYSDLKKLM